MSLPSNRVEKFISTLLTSYIYIIMFLVLEVAIKYIFKFIFMPFGIDIIVNSFVDRITIEAILSIIFIHSLFFMGSILFKKHSFIKNINFIIWFYRCVVYNNDIIRENIWSNIRFV